MAFANFVVMGTMSGSDSDSPSTRLHIGDGVIHDYWNSPLDKRVYRKFTVKVLSVIQHQERE